MSTILPPASTAGQPALNPNQALWEKGDFTRIANSMRASGTELVAQLGLRPGLKVLDLGSGDGTTALPAARLGADVLAVDIARNLVSAGNRRKHAAGLTNLRFQQGDASQLVNLADRTYDVVVSIFGAMFAPRPIDVAREMVRVTKPGGRIIMGNWIPGDPTLVAQILQLSSRYTPAAPTRSPSPMLWGVEAHVLERFAAAGIPAARVHCEKASFTFDFPGSPTAFVDAFLMYYGPTMSAFEAAERDGRGAELRRDLEALFADQNQVAEARRTLIAATYLRVTVDV